MSGNPEFTKRFGTNMVSNLVFLVLNMAIGVLLVPFYIDNLGLAAYGIVPLATSITSYVVLISDALCSSVSRYMCVNIQGGDIERSETIYSTATFGILRIALLLVPVISLVSFLSPSIFDTHDIPDTEVMIMFLLIFASVLLQSWSYIFTIVMFANNRLDCQNFIKSLQIVIQVVVIVVLFAFVNKSLVSIGIAYAIAAIVSAIVSYLLSRRISPELKPIRSRFDSVVFQDICKLGGWNVFNSLGNLLFVQASIIVSNILLGPEIEGAFTTVTTMLQAVIVLGGTLSTVFTPITYYNYANNRLPEMVHTCVMAIKAVGMFIAIPLAYLCMFSDQVLTVWVGSEFTFLKDTIWIMLPFLVISTAVSPIYPISMAKLKVRVPGIMTLVFGISNVLMGIVFVEVLNMGIEGIALAWTISMTIKNCIFNTWYHAYIIEEKYSSFMKPLIPGVIIFALSCVMYHALIYAIPITSSIITLLIIAVLSFFPILILGITVFMNHDEKQKMKACLPEKLQRYMGRFI